MTEHSTGTPVLDNPSAYRKTTGLPDSGQHSMGKSNHKDAPTLPSPLPVNPAGAKGTLTSQVHHLIPNRLTPTASKYLADLALEGLYDHQSLKYNGVSLPNDKDIAEAIGAARHSGDHPAYSEFVSRMVDEIAAEETRLILEDGVHPEVARRQSAENIKKLQAYLLHGLFDTLDVDSKGEKIAERGLILNSSDSQSPGDQDEGGQN